MNSRILAPLCILAGSILVGAVFWVWVAFIAGGGGPKISNLTVAPDAFRFSGGKLLVQAEVSGDQIVDQVTGILLASGAEVVRVDLQRIETDPKAEADDPIYSGKLLVPANVRSDGQAIEYTLQLLATNIQGQESQKEADFQVPAPSRPPAPPD